MGYDDTTEKIQLLARTLALLAARRFIADVLNEPRWQNYYADDVIKEYRDILAVIDEALNERV